MSQITSLGKYHILERLTADWMSESFKVKTVGIAGFEKVQVLKRILRQYSRDPRFFRAFIEESKIAFSLNHRNIVQVFEFGKTGEELFLAIEHIPGISLRDVIDAARARGKRFPAGLICYVMGEVASGLEYAHRKSDHAGRNLGIVHCLLHPGNIACSFEGSVKILDFGIARTAWQMAPRGNRYPGEPRYLSPDQIRGEAMDASSDLFSFGAILWELLTGLPLFDALDIDAIFRKILYDSIPSPRTLADGIPSSLDELAMTCLSRDLHERTTSASTMQAELHRVQRQLGAVIGSRALAAFLVDLFPGTSDSRDARQPMDPRGPLLPAPAAPRPHREEAPMPEEASDEDSLEEDLLLDRPGHAFPDPSPLPSVSPRPRRSTPRRSIGEASAARAPARLPRESVADQAVTAGVLRSGRPLDEEPLAPPIREGRSAPEPSGPDPDLAPTDRRRRGPHGARAAEEPSIVELADRELEDDFGAPGLSRRASQGRPSAPRVRTADAPPADEDPSSVPLLDAPLDQPLHPTGSDAVAAWLLQASAQKALLAPRPRAPGVEAVDLDTQDPVTSPVASSPAASPEEPVDPRGEPDAEPTIDPSAALPAPVPSWPEPEPQAVSRSPRDPDPERVLPLAVQTTEGLTASDTAQERTTQETLTEEQAGPGLCEKKRCIAVAVRLGGPEQSRAEAQNILSDIAYKLDGFLHHRDHQSLFVLFGLPATDENDIVSAVRFALDSQEAVSQLDPSLRTGARARPSPSTPHHPLEVRIGVRAALARLAGPTVRSGYKLLGHANRDMQQLLDDAPAGQVLLSGLAVHLARPHYALELDPASSTPGRMGRVHRVIGPLRDARPRGPGALGPLQGREVELQAIKTCWRQCLLNRQQQGVLLVGEAGIGKSAVLDHALEAVASEGRVLAARSTPLRRGTPNALLADLLAVAVDPDPDPESPLPDRLARALPSLLGPAADQAVEALLSLLHPSRPRGSGSIHPHRLHRALRLLLNRTARSTPLVLVVEDLHWADRTSVEALSALLDAPDEAEGPLLLLITMRPDENAVPAHLFQRPGTTLVLLDELDDADRMQLIRTELAASVSPELMRDVASRAGGNPLYIKELTREIRETGATRLAEVPPTVQRVIAARVDRLSPPVKAVLQHAAVIGPTFREAILGRLLGRNPARALGALRNQGIILPGLHQLSRRKNRGDLAEQFEREWAFRNTLVREVVYEDIAPSSRRKLHLRVGEIMSERAAAGSGDGPADIARHLELGGDRRGAAAFYLEAAHEAASVCAGEEALRLYAHVLELGQEDPEQQYQALLGHEQVCRQLGLHQRQEQDLERIRVLVGDDPERTADLRNREARLLLRRGEAYRALVAAEQAEEAAVRCGAELLQGEALRLRGEAYERLGDHRRAMSVAGLALTIFERLQAVTHQIGALIDLGRLELVRARYDEALTLYEQAFDLAKQSDDRFFERILRHRIAVAHFCLGNLPQALGEALYSLNLCEQYGDLARRGDNATVVGIAYLELGQLASARQYLELALGIHRQSGSQWSEADTLVYLGLLEVAEHRFAPAMDHLDQALVVAGRIGARMVEINAHNARALCLCERQEPGDAELAVSEGEAGADQARALGLVVGEIPGLSRAARALAQTGDLERARSLSRRAVELLQDQRTIESSEEEIFYTYYRLLRELGDPAAARYLELAHRGLQDKLARLDSGDWAQSFIQVPLHAAILRDSTPT